MKKSKDNHTSSFFVGRWQPFHKGHKALIESVLKKGKPVVIAIRDTEISRENPYSVAERWTMIQKSLKSYVELVKIIVIPDIDEVCFGRDVGYDIRKIDIDRETEKISGRKIRRRAHLHPIYWITGQSNSGKTALANNLQKEIGGVVLDGDEMRKSISLGASFSKKDRHEHNLRVARLAQVLSSKNLVIVSVIAPFESTRKKLSKMINPIWIYVKRTLPKEKDKPYEPPKNPDVAVDTDIQTPKQQLKIVLAAIGRTRIKTPGKK